MKRLFFFFGVMAALCVQQTVAQVAMVALSHNGSLTMYEAESLPTALNDAVEGDTIFLNEGFFPGFTISKPITVIGAGQKTNIKGGVTIEVTGTLTARTLDALNINGSLSGGSSTGLVVRKCKFKGFSCGSLINAIIDRCYCESNRFDINKGVKNMQVVNSVISNLYGFATNASDITFLNCNILSFDYTNYVRATFVNCIVRNYYKQADSYFSYCRLLNDNGTNTMQNCSCSSFSWNNTYNYSPGMNGTDGTVVGINGGTTPFTLTTSNPKVTSYEVKVDTQNKQLNVNVTVTAN